MWRCLGGRGHAEIKWLGRDPKKDRTRGTRGGKESMKEQNGSPVDRLIEKGGPANGAKWTMTSTGEGGENRKKGEK